MRTIRNRPATPVQERPADANLDGTLTADLHITTMLKGGGAVAGKVDDSQPIRGNAVRGLLRYWWRATSGHRYETVDQLRMAEDGLWGSTSNPSPVRVRVVTENRGQRRPMPARISGSETSYVFGLLGRDSNQLLHGVRARLEMDFPPSRQREIERALVAWTTFGGYGARSRRGAGALAPWLPSSLYASADDPVEFLRAVWDFLAVPSKPTLASQVPMLTSTSQLLVSPAQPDSDSAWCEAIRVLRVYRQFGGHVEGDAIHHSPWPEGDSLRHMFGQELAPPNAHGTHPRTRFEDTGLFPRAALGLPIGIRFKDRGVQGQWREPPPVMVTWSAGDRWASPVLLKPLLLPGGKAAPLLLAFHPPALPDDSRLRMSNRPRAPGSAQEWEQHTDAVGDWIEGKHGEGLRSPVTNQDLLAGQRDAILGLVETARRAGWKRVRP